MSASLAARIDQLSERRRLLLEQLRQHPTGHEWCELHSELADEAVRAVFESVGGRVEAEPQLALVATGGYSRRELAPHSDIDLTLVPLEGAEEGLDDLVREMFKDLHSAFDTLGIKIGYAFRLVSDAPGLDDKTRTGLMDARLVAGAHEPFDLLMDAMWNSFPVGPFLIAKLRERQEFLERYHDTPMVVEPQLKEGAGGLRSFQCANWLRMAVGERYSRPPRHYDHILQMRNMLHLVAGKQLDVLSRQRQAEIADLLEQDVYEMMAQVVDAGLFLHQEFMHACEKIHEARYDLAEGVTVLRGEARIGGRATLSEAAIGIADATQLGLRVPDLPAIAQPEVDGPQVLYAIRTGEATIRNLDRCGLLAALLPELSRCKTLMPRDSTHTFTVFEHTLRVVRNLDGLQRGTFLGDLKNGLRDLEVLYLAALLHDAGKAIEGRPHSETGEELVRGVSARWSLHHSITEPVAWLVKEHLSMAMVIRMRDVQHPQTAQEFAALVQTQERLDMLTLLTWADVAAVAEGAWTPVQDSFLRELHARTSMVLSGQQQEEHDPALYRRRLTRHLKGDEIAESEVEAFLASLPAHYLMSVPPDLIRLHMQFERLAREGQPTVEIFHQPELAITDVTVCCLDEPGLLSKMLGVLYAHDLSVHAIRASTTRTDQPVALDVFSVSFGERPVPAATCQALANSMRKVILNELNVDDLLRQKGKDPERMQQAYQFTYREGQPGILEFRAPRGRGMAFRFSRLIAQQGWNITAARVGQWAGKGAASFYITGKGDRPLQASEVEEALTGKV